MPRLKTPNDGAAAVKRDIKAAVKVMIQSSNSKPWISGDDLITFIDGMAKRASAKPGGLGRNPKKK